MSQKTIALLGNQNCGKTTLFNVLTGSNQYVGNWPGVTVDKVIGKISSKDWDVVDLPGLYSLSPYSPEEIVSRNYLLTDDYDVILNIVDASHLERSLSLTLELAAFGKPMVVALNMIDVMEKSGIKIDVDKL
ncbi:MAG: FeoB small GTPase domain-containing protein, partial [Succinivibrio dextrinosolvens]|nr:FeoB small GTPase domain-containing protein [Succinivibrio dextrinosolvens]